MPKLEYLNGQIVEKVEQYKTDKGLDAVKIETNKGVYSLSTYTYRDSEKTFEVVSGDEYKPLSYLEGKTLISVGHNYVEHKEGKTTQIIVFETNEDGVDNVIVEVGIAEILEYDTIYTFETLHNKLVKDDMDYCEIVDLLCELNVSDLEYDIMYEYPNLEFRVVESVSNTDGSAWTVYYFPKQDVYVQHQGFYNSYNGCTEYEEHSYKEVKPKTVVNTTYEEVDGKGETTDITNDKFEQSALQWFKDNFQNPTKDQIIDLYGKYMSEQG